MRSAAVNRSRALWVTLAAAVPAACASLTPYEQVRRALPAERFLEVGSRAVYVEQAGEGEALLLIHGFGGSTYSWRRVIPGLAEHRRVVAVDISGFGWTERVGDPSAYTLAGQERLLLGVLDALGIERADVAGHSYGGGIALWLASRHPERVRSLVLVDSTLPSYGFERRSNVARSRTAVSAFLRGFALRRSFVRSALERSFFDKALITDELVDEYLRRLRVEGAVDAYRGLTMPVEEPRPEVDLTAVGQPTLVVWGADDELLPARLGEQAAGAMPLARLVVIDRCGHIPIEERPEEFLVAVVPFLAAVGEDRR
jgi:pimeloyl-ACP methyl ester carboxylesterase